LGFVVVAVAAGGSGAGAEAAEMGGRWWEQMDWGGELGQSGSGGRDLVMVDGLGSLVRVHNFLHSLTERSPERAKQQVKRPDFLRFLNRIRLPFLGISVTRGGDETFVKSLDTKEEVISGGLLLHEAAAAAGPHPKSIEGERVEAEAAARTTTTAFNTDLLFQLPTQASFLCHCSKSIVLEISLPISENTHETGF
jgi:hypothetical protein